MSVLDSIIDNKKNKNEFFNQYKKSEDVCKEMLADFKKIYVKDKGFPLDKHFNKENFGIISNCMGLSTLLEFYSLDVDLDKYMDMFFNVLQLIFNDLYKEDEIIYSASPYLFNNSEFHITSYTETISKVIIVMTDLRDWIYDNLERGKKLSFNLKIQGKSITKLNDLLIEVESVLIHSIGKICSNAIPHDNPTTFTIEGIAVKRNNSSLITHKGWAFQGFDNDDENEIKNYDSSLYFTYHATNAFLNFYNAFSEIFDKYYENDSYDEYKNSLSGAKLNKFIANESFFERNKDLINEYRSIVISCGRYLDAKLNENNVDLSFDFVNSNLLPLSVNNISFSQHNNAILETLFTIAILINCGIDDDYASVRKKDNFLEKTKFSLLNCKKVFSIYKQKNIDDFIKTYTLNFSEKYPTKYNDLIKKLRENLRVVGLYDFVPLYFNTYATISSFLIKYPQIDMVDNLEMVFENKYENKKEDSENYKWMWPKDGYNCNNYLYYIFAVENFYDYYYDYELPLSEKGENYNIAKLEAQSERNEALKQQDLLQKENQELRSKLENKKSELDEAVVKLIDKELNEKIEKAIYDYLNDLVSDGIKFSLDIAKKKQQNSVDGYSLPNDIYKGHDKVKLLHTIADSLNFQKIVDSDTNVLNKRDDAQVTAIENKIEDDLIQILEEGESK